MQVTRFGVGNFVGVIEAGKVKALAVSSAKRSPVLPNVPTFAEVGWGDYPGQGWWGLAAPKGTPPEIVAKLSSEFQKLFSDPKFVAFLDKQAVVAAPTTPDGLCGVPQAGPQGRRDADQDRQHQEDGIQGIDGRTPCSIVAICSPPRRRACSRPVSRARALAQAVKKPVHVIVGFPAGGGTDVTARVLAEALRGAYASTVLVENKPGASARIAVEYVKNAEPDGSVMLFTPDFPMTLYPHSFKSLSYDPLTDFTPVGPATTSMLSYNVGPAVPAERQVARRLCAVVQGQSGQGELRHHLGRRHAALRRRHAVERSEGAAESGALPRRRAGAAGRGRRTHPGQRQSDQREHAAAPGGHDPDSRGHRGEALAVPARCADHDGAGLQRRGRSPGSACSCPPRRPTMCCAR